MSLGYSLLGQAENFSSPILYILMLYKFKLLTFPEIISSIKWIYFNPFPAAHLETNLMAGMCAFDHKINKSCK